MQGPDNAVYMWVAYSIVCLVYFGYVLVLWRRMRRVGKGDVL